MNKSVENAINYKTIQFCNRYSNTAQYAYHAQFNYFFVFTFSKIVNKFQAFNAALNFFLYARHTYSLYLQKHATRKREYSLV